MLRTELGQAVFVMYRYISRTYFKFRRKHIAEMPSVAMDTVIIPIEAVSLKAELK